MTFLERFNEQLEHDTQLGQLDSAALLTHHLESYFQLLAPLEANLDRLDERILKVDGQQRTHLETLAGLRRRVSDLRRLLIPIAVISLLLSDMTRTDLKSCAAE